MSKEIQAILMLSGMIIGVGMFAIPFSFSVAGFWLGALELCVLAIAILAVHISYGEVVLHTNERHRLPGYVRKYMGDRAAFVASASVFFGAAGTLLAYMLIGGVFLHGLVQESIPVSSPAFWSVVLAGIGAVVTFFPLGKKARITSMMTAFLIIFLILLIGFLLPRVHRVNLGGFHAIHAFAPYGVLLFALAGATAVPEVVLFLKGTRRRTRQVIAFGSLMPAALYFLFALAVVGVSGGNVSPDAIAGLLPVAGRGIVTLGNIIGLLAVTTAYIILNSNFQWFLTLDLGVSRRMAWAGGSFLPLFLFILGFQSFIAVISIVGATTVAIDGALILATYHTILHRREKSITLADTIRFGLLYAIMITGIGYELYRFVFSYIV